MSLAEFNYTKQIPNVKSSQTGMNPARRRTVGPDGNMCGRKGIKNRNDVFNAMPTNDIMWHGSSLQGAMIRHEDDTMLRWIHDSLSFLLWLGVLQLARLAVVLLCVAEVLTVLTLWVVGFIAWQTHDRPIYLLIPIGATLLVAVQVALWQFTWLRIAQRGGHWRAIAECFSRVVRYPVLRTPRAWE
jgi:hypothetical protein